MNVYQYYLPKCFTKVAVLPTQETQVLVNELMRIRTDMPQGSSFAVTVDVTVGYQRLWLSDASYLYLLINLDSELAEKLTKHQVDTSTKESRLF